VYSVLGVIDWFSDWVTPGLPWLPDFHGYPVIMITIKLGLWVTLRPGFPVVTREPDERQ